ncbi:MAG: hypothetical protein KDE34_21535, partial [Anaerolineales bacterium]|nr:hypothetical protein [Anaerolineales bacterium]
RAVSAAGRSLSELRDELFEVAGLQRHHLVLDLNAGTGLLTWEALRQVPEGGVWSLAAEPQSGTALRQQAERLKELERPVVLIGAIDELPDLLALRDDESLRFDRIMGRNLWADLRAAPATLTMLREKLQPDGFLCWAQLQPRGSQRLYRLVDWPEELAELRERVAAGEESLYSDPADPLVNWTAADVEAALRAAGYSQIAIRPVQQASQRQHDEAHLARWFGTVEARGRYAEQLLAAGLAEKELAQVERLYRRAFLNRPVPWQTSYLLVKAL